MFRKVCLLLVLSYVSLHASIFDWSVPLSPKAERAKFLLEGVDPLIEKALKDFGIPGLSVGVVVDGHVVLAKGYGVRDLDTGYAVNAETVFAIGSCTKAFTTLALGMLVEQRLLGWDWRMRDILPEFQLFDRDASEHATLRDLVSNRTGLSRHDFMWYNSNYSRQELLEKARYLEPLYSFRERYYYNSLMFVIASMALEKATGKTWEEFVQTNILNPLKMYSTHFSVDELKRGKNVASPYISKEGGLKKVAFRSFANVAPTAGINSTAQDMTHWMKMLLDQGTYEQKRLISPVSIQEIQSPQIVNGGYPEFSELLINSYGLGWDILSYRGHYCVGHDGGVDGFTSVLCLLPQDGVGVVVLSNKNRASLPRVLAYEIFDRVLELPLRGWLQIGVEGIQKSAKEAVQPVDKQRKMGTTPSQSLEKFEGFYEHPGYGTMAVEKKGEELHATLHGITYVLNHWHYDVFNIGEEFPDILFSRKGEKVCFHNNWLGEVEELSIPLDWGPPPIRFKKKPDEAHSNLAYLRQFTGTYQYFHALIEVSLQGQSLVALIPGYPIFTLSPSAENEFQIREKPGYAVRFVKGGDGGMEEAQLIPPFGGTYSARPKR